jgi:hypothetical protein
MTAPRAQLKPGNAVSRSDAYRHVIVALALVCATIATSAALLLDAAQATAAVPAPSHALRAPTVIPPPPRPVRFTLPPVDEPIARPRPVVVAVRRPAAGRPVVGTPYGVVSRASATELTKAGNELLVLTRVAIGDEIPDSEFDSPALRRLKRTARTTLFGCLAGALDAAVDEGSDWISGDARFGDVANSALTGCIGEMFPTPEAIASQVSRQLVTATSDAIARAAGASPRLAVFRTRVRRFGQ